MTLLLFSFFAGLGASSLASTPAPSVRWDVIRRALCQVETGCNPKAIGAKGEITEYQILPAIWVTECRLGGFPPHDRRSRDRAWFIAHRLLQRRVNTFASTTKRVPSPREIYALWNAPGTFAEKGYRWNLLSPAVKERCLRFAALCETGPGNRRVIARGAFPWFDENTPVVTIAQGR